MPFIQYLIKIISPSSPIEVVLFQCQLWFFLSPKTSDDLRLLNFGSFPCHLWCFLRFDGTNFERVFDDDSNELEFEKRVLFFSCSQETEMQTLCRLLNLRNVQRHETNKNKSASLKCSAWEGPRPILWDYITFLNELNLNLKLFLSLYSNYVNLLLCHSQIRLI